MPDIEDRDEVVNYSDLKLLPGKMEILVINARHPLPDGQGGATEVHLIINLDQPLQGFGVLMRFKGPETLGALIEQLERYRKEVFG